MARKGKTYNEMIHQAKALVKEANEQGNEARAERIVKIYRHYARNMLRNLYKRNSRTQKYHTPNLYSSTMEMRNIMVKRKTYMAAVTH